MARSAECPREAQTSYLQKHIGNGLVFFKMCKHHWGWGEGGVERLRHTSERPHLDLRLVALVFSLENRTKAELSGQ